MRNLENSLPSSFQGVEAEDIDKVIKVKAQEYYKQVDNLIKLQSLCLSDITAYNMDIPYKAIKDRVQQVDELKPPHASQTWSKVGKETWSCAWSPDSSYFAWSCGDKFVRLVPWDRETGRLSKKARQYSGGQRNEEEGENIYELAPVNDEENTKTSQQKPIFVIDCKEYVWSVAFGSGSSKSKQQWKRFKFERGVILATGLQTGRIKLWDCVTGNLLMELLDHRDIVRGLSFAPNGSLHLASASLDGSLKLWDLNDDGNMYKTLRDTTNRMHACKWSNDCQLIAAVGSNKFAVIWNTKEFGNPKHLRGHQHDVVSCDFSRDSSLLATASYDTRIIIWDPCTGDSLAELGHMFPPPRLIFAGGANDHYVRGISFDRDGLSLCSVSDDGFVRVWDLTDTYDPCYVAEHQSILCCQYSPEGDRISVGDREGGVKFYTAPQTVPQLQHLCRSTIRSYIHSTKVDHLHLPLRLKEYLKYHIF